MTLARSLDMAVDGSQLTLQAAGDLKLEQGARLSSRGNITLAGQRVVGVDVIDAAAIEITGGGTLSVTSETALGLGRIETDGHVILRANGTDLAALNDSLLALSVADLRAGSLEAFGAGIVAGRYHVAGDVDIEAAWSLGVIAADGTVLVPLTLVTDPDLGRVRLVGEYGAAVALEGLPGAAAITINELRTGTGQAGQFVDGAGTLRTLAEVVPDPVFAAFLAAQGFSVDGPLNAWRGTGIRLTGVGFPNVTLGSQSGDGLSTVNAPVSIEVGRFTQSTAGAINTFGGDLTIRDSVGGTPVTLAGVVATGGGDVTVEGRTGLRVTSPINSGGGNVRLSTDTAFVADNDPVVISSIFRQGGNIVVEAGPFTGLEFASGTLDAGNGRVRLAAGTDAVLLGSIVSTGAFAQGNAVEIDIPGTLTTDAGSPRESALVTAAVPSRVRITAGQLGATAERPLLLRVGGLDLRAEAGAIHALNDGNLRVLGIQSADGSLIDVFVEGNMAGAGPVISQAPGGARGDVVLTARGSIIGTFTQLVGDKVHLVALEGGIGASPLAVADSDVATYRVLGRQKVDLALPAGGLRAAWVLSQGPVSLSAAGDIEVALLGSPSVPLIDGPGKIEIRNHGAAMPLSVRPSTAAGVINAADYPALAVLAPGGTVPDPGPDPTPGTDPGPGDPPAVQPDGGSFLPERLAQRFAAGLRGPQGTSLFNTRGAALNMTLSHLSTRPPRPRPLRLPLTEETDG